jgi:hypothetical protein
VGHRFYDFSAVIELAELIANFQPFCYDAPAPYRAKALEGECHMILPELKSLKPEDNELEQLLILILKLSYNISEADAELIHQLSLNMFHQGCVEGAETVMTALQTEAKLHQVASTPSSRLSN